MYIAITVDVEPDFPSKKYKGIKELNKFLDINYESFTLFITPQIFKKFPELIEKWSKKHEIGFHIHPQYLGYNNDYFNNYSKEVQKELFIKGLKIISGVYDLNKLKSFRVGRFAYSEYIFQILEEFGFTHDSSIYPNALSNNKPKKIKNIIEVSPTIWTLQPLKLLYKMGFFKTGGLVFYGRAFKKFYRKTLYTGANKLSDLHYFVFAFHPYDLLDLNLKYKIRKFINFLLNRRKPIKISEISI